MPLSLADLGICGGRAGTHDPLSSNIFIFMQFLDKN